MRKAANAIKPMLKAMRVRCFIRPRYPRPRLPSTVVKLGGIGSMVAYALPVQIWI